MSVTSGLAPYSTWFSSAASAHPPESPSYSNAPKVSKASFNVGSFPGSNFIACEKAPLYWKYSSSLSTVPATFKDMSLLFEEV